MRKYILSGLLCAFYSMAQAQIEQPVKWSYAAKQTGNKEAIVYLKASIEGSWHIYGTHQKEGGPVKTSFTFSPSPDYQLLGELTEPRPQTKFEQSFGINVDYFEKSVIFSQKIKLHSAAAAVKGTLTYMSCNDQKCLPPETISFNIPVK